MSSLLQVIRCDGNVCSLYSYSQSVKELVLEIRLKVCSGSKNFVPHFLFSLKMC